MVLEKNTLEGRLLYREPPASTLLRRIEAVFTCTLNGLVMGGCALMAGWAFVSVVLVPSVSSLALGLFFAFVSYLAFGWLRRSLTERTAVSPFSVFEDGLVPPEGVKPATGSPAAMKISWTQIASVTHSSTQGGSPLVRLGTDEGGVFYLRRSQLRPLARANPEAFGLMVSALRHLDTMRILTPERWE